MDTKLLFLIGLMILVLSTCSINPTRAESGINGQVHAATMCSTSQQIQGCPVQLH